MNQLIYDLATKSSNISNEDKDLLNYTAMAEKIGDPDIINRPFIVNQFATYDTSKYFLRLKNILDSEIPVETSLCEERLGPAAPTGIPGSCSPHAVVIVGIGYVNDVCTIRIKNSWGEQ